MWVEKGELVFGPFIGYIPVGYGSDIYIIIRNKLARVNPIILASIG
jgi:hypothetical protein